MALILASPSSHRSRLWQDRIHRPDHKRSANRVNTFFPASYYISVSVLILADRLYPHQIDLYFTWASPGFRQFTDPIKLTTWRQEIAHKLMSASGPPSLHQHHQHQHQYHAHNQAAITWSLGLFACPAGTTIPTASATFINLTDLSSSLTNVLPVFSAPIEFSPLPSSSSSRGQSRSAANYNKSRASISSASNSKKQDEIQRVYLLPSALEDKLQGQAISPGWRSVIITEKTSPDLDKVSRLISISSL